MSNLQKRNPLKRLLSSIGFLLAPPDLNTDDRRCVPRLICDYTVSFVSDQKVRSEARLIDVSSRGLRLETPEPLAPGRTLALNPPAEDDLTNHPPLMARVVWSEPGPRGNYRSGLCLPSGLEDETTWLDQVLNVLGYHDDGSQRRRHIRAGGEVQGRLRLEGENEDRAVSILNLGMGGALIRSPEAFPKNSQFSLEVGPHRDLPALAVEGTVLRVMERKECTLHPCRFRPLDESDETLLREYILNLLGTE